MSRVTDPILVGCFSVKEVPVATAVDLPDSIIGTIMHFASPADAESLGSTCRQYRSVFTHMMPLTIYCAHTGAWTDLTAEVAAHVTEHGLSVPHKVLTPGDEPLYVQYTDDDAVYQSIFSSTEDVAIKQSRFRLLRARRGLMRNITRPLRDCVQRGRRLFMPSAQRQAMFGDDTLEIAFRYRGQEHIQLHTFPLGDNVILQPPLLVLRALLHCKGETASLDVTERVKKMLRPRIPDGPLALDMSNEDLCTQLQVVDPDPVALKQMALQFIPAGADTTYTRVMSDGDYLHIPPLLHILSATYRSCSQREGRPQRDVTEVVQHMAAAQGHSLSLPAISKRELPQLAGVIGDMCDEEMELAVVFLADDGTSKCTQRLVVAEDCEPFTLP